MDSLGAFQTQLLNDDTSRFQASKSMPEDARVSHSKYSAISSQDSQALIDKSWDGLNLTLLERKIKSLPRGGQKIRAYKLLTYKKELQSGSDLRRVGIESQCSSLVMTHNDQPIHFKVTSGSHETHNAKGKIETNALDKARLEKGQVLIASENKTAGIPVLSVTADCFDKHQTSEKHKIYCTEIMTSPLSKEDFREMKLQQSIEDLESTLGSLNLGKNPVSNVVETYNSHKKEGSIDLSLKNSFPSMAKVSRIRELSKAEDFCIFQPVEKKRHWGKQFNISTPFASLGKLPELVRIESTTKQTYKFDSFIKNDLIKALIKSDFGVNAYCRAWLMHLIYISYSYASSLNHYFTDQRREFLTLKGFPQNARYSHHQFAMEIIDDEGFTLLRKHLLDRSDTLEELQNVLISLSINGKNDNAVRLFEGWIKGYMNDLILMSEIRALHGRNTVFDPCSDEPFIISNETVISLPFKASEHIQAFNTPDNSFYKYVFPIAYDAHNVAWTVIERRAGPTDETIKTTRHFPFTFNSNWCEQPSDIEKELINIYWP